MEVLYKVLIVIGMLFVAAGIIYVLYFLPQVPQAPATPPQSTGYLPINTI